MIAGVTHVGTLGSDARAQVDDRGRVTLPTGWELDWWVGAEDRWHLPEHEAAVRQALVGNAPVVETAMRIPGGDALHRVYAVPRAEGVGALLVVEVENRSAVPIAVAFARCGTEGAAASVALARPPADRQVAGDLAVDVVPLPHTASIQVVTAIDGGPVERFPDVVPTSASVAKGWEAQAGRGVRVELPEPVWMDAFAASRCQLLLGELGDGRLADEEDGRTWSVAGPIVRALDRLGLHPEAERVLLRLASDGAPDDSGAALFALDHHVRLTDNRALARGLVEAVADMAHAHHRLTFRRGRRLRTAALVTRDTADGFTAAGRLLLAAGEERAAADARADAAAVLGAAGGGEPPNWPSPPGPRPPLGAAARFVEAVSDAALRFDDDGLLLAPAVPDTWLGQGWEVHDASTPVGAFSYAVRWHGDRPALLWHLEPHRTDGPAVRLSAPGLDPAWSTTEPRGEALLAPAAPRAAGSFS